MIKAGVVGVGHLGKFHARKFAAIADVELYGVADVSADRAEEVGRGLKTRVFTDYRDLFGQVDLVSIVVPTTRHFEVAAAFLDAGIHVLLEKPITSDLAEAENLVRMARKAGLVLQVGHIERFNPVMTAARDLLERPLFIDADRLSPFQERGTDVDVVLDLMIHDIDLTLSLVKEEPRTVQAVGAPVLTPLVDIANARLEFDSGCVATLNASRIASKPERKFRVFQKDSYLALNLGRQRIGFSNLHPLDDAGRATIDYEKIPVPAGDALEAEIRSFIHAVAGGTPPPVSGEDGLRALRVAFRINEEIQSRPSDPAACTFDQPSIICE